MKRITQLPRRPLLSDELVALDDRLVSAVPYGGITDNDEVRFYAIKIATTTGAHALGYDDAEGHWQHLASTDSTDLDAADSQLDVVLDDWVQSTYTRQFDVVKAL
ncbi:hypothetical protein [Halorubellus litoreus]|uniref:DUF7964 domain-containing protein n=1 Tax=Halorubellus litoreus TaxID=755308 RepID=A0ABD5VDB4_9EURY